MPDPVGVVRAKMKVSWRHCARKWRIITRHHIWTQVSFRVKFHNAICIKYQPDHNTSKKTFYHATGDFFMDDNGANTPEPNRGLLNRQLRNADSAYKYMAIRHFGTASNAAMPDRMLLLEQAFAELAILLARCVGNLTRLALALAHSYAFIEEKNFDEAIQLVDCALHRLAPNDGMRGEAETLRERILRDSRWHGDAALQDSRARQRQRYAVGVIMRHVRYDYYCVVYSRDDVCRQPDRWKRRMVITRSSKTLGSPNPAEYRVLFVFRHSVSRSSLVAPTSRFTASLSTTTRLGVYCC